MHAKAEADQKHLTSPMEFRFNFVNWLGFTGCKCMEGFQSGHSVCPSCTFFLIQHLDARMIIGKLKRPWVSRTPSQGPRYNPDQFYQSTLWKRTRAAFILGRTLLVNGRTKVAEWLSNTLCHECFRVRGALVPMHTVDHIKQIAEGGSKTDTDNLQSLCRTCHARKSAMEANQSKQCKN